MKLDTDKRNAAVLIFALAATLAFLGSAIDPLAALGAVVGWLVILWWVMWSRGSGRR